MLLEKDVCLRDLIFNMACRYRWTQTFCSWRK